MDAEAHELDMIATAQAKRIEDLEAALRKIVDGPPAGMKFEEAGGPFEKFACEIAYDALQKATPVT